MNGIRKILTCIYPSKAIKCQLVISGIISKAFNAKNILLFIRPHSPKSCLSLVKVSKYIDKSLEDKLDRYIENMLSEANRILENMNIENYEKKIVAGMPSEKILEELKLNDYDLVILGTTGLKGILHCITGRVSLKVAQHSKIPTLIVRKPCVLRSMLIGTDGSKYAEKAIDFAGMLAEKLDSKVTLISIAKRKRDIKKYEENVERGAEILKKYNITDINKIVRVGNVREELIKEADNYDVIVLGPRGLGRIKRLLLGHVSMYVASRTDINLLLVK